MAPYRQVLVLLWLFWIGFLSGITEASDRLKRELRFPKGGSFVAAVALASFLPKGPTDGLAHVLEFDLGFPFPEKIAIGERRAEKKTLDDVKATKRRKPFRGKRSLKRDQRKNLLGKVENIMNRIGLNGSSCSVRFRCELRTISPKNSLLEELLFALFETSDLDDKECELHNQSCPISLLHVVMHSEQISTPSWI